MNKLTKVLALIGATTGVAYLTKKMMAPSNLESKASSNNRNVNATVPDRNVSKSYNNVDTDFSNERTQRMYKDLGMTDEQRLRYEADYRTVMDKWEKQNPNVTMDKMQKTAEHNSALKAVLNEAQFSNYREWAKNHAY